MSTGRPVLVWLHTFSPSQCFEKEAKQKCHCNPNNVYDRWLQWESSFLENSLLSVILTVVGWFSRILWYVSWAMNFTELGSNWVLFLDLRTLGTLFYFTQKFGLSRSGNIYIFISVFYNVLYFSDMSGNQSNLCQSVCVTCDQFVHWNMTDLMCSHRY